MSGAAFYDRRCYTCGYRLYPCVKFIATCPQCNHKTFIYICVSSGIWKRTAVLCKNCDFNGRHPLLTEGSRSEKLNKKIEEKK